MKACELIALLKEMPQDAICVRSGYEGGLKKISKVYSVNKDEDCIAIYID